MFYLVVVYKNSLLGLDIDWLFLYTLIRGLDPWRKKEKGERRAHSLPWRAKKALTVMNRFSDAKYSEFWAPLSRGLRKKISDSNVFFIPTLFAHVPPPRKKSSPRSGSVRLGPNTVVEITYPEGFYGVWARRLIAVIGLLQKVGSVEVKRYGLSVIPFPFKAASFTRLFSPSARSAEIARVRALLQAVTIPQGTSDSSKGIHIKVYDSTKGFGEVTVPLLIHNGKRVWINPALLSLPLPTRHDALFSVLAEIKRSELSGSMVVLDLILHFRARMHYLLSRKKKTTIYAYSVIDQILRWRSGYCKAFRLCKVAFVRAGQAFSKIRTIIDGHVFRIAV